MNANDENIAGNELPKPKEKQDTIADIDFQDFLLEAKDSTSGYFCNLSSMESLPNGNKKFAHIKRFENYIPSQDEIGNLGAGGYRLTAFYTDSKGKRIRADRNVYIDQKYIELKAKEQHKNAGGNGASGQLPAIIGGNGTEAMQPTLTLIKELVGSFSPIMEKMLDIKADQLAAMQDTQEQMNKVIFSQAQQMQGVMNMLFTHQVQNITGVTATDEQEEKGIDWKDIFNFLWQEYGQKILTGSKSVQKMYAAQASQYMQQIYTDPQGYIEGYNDLISQAGKEKVDKLLSILGAPDPNQLAEQLQQQAAGQQHTGQKEPPFVTPS